MYGPKSGESQTTFLKILGNGVGLKLRPVESGKVGRAWAGPKGWAAARLLVDEREWRFRAIAKARPLSSTPPTTRALLLRIVFDSGLPPLLFEVFQGVGVYVTDVCVAC